MVGARDMCALQWGGGVGIRSGLVGGSEGV